MVEGRFTKKHWRKEYGDPDSVIKLVTGPLLEPEYSGTIIVTPLTVRQPVLNMDPVSYGDADDIFLFCTILLPDRSGRLMLRMVPIGVKKGDQSLHPKELMKILEGAANMKEREFEIIRKRLTKIVQTTKSVLLKASDLSALIREVFKMDQGNSVSHHIDRLKADKVIVKDYGVGPGTVWRILDAKAADEQSRKELLAKTTVARPQKPERIPPPAPSAATTPPIAREVAPAAPAPLERAPEQTAAAPVVHEPAAVAEKNAIEPTPEDKLARFKGDLQEGVELRVEKRKKEEKISHMMRELEIINQKLADEDPEITDSIDFVLKSLG